MFEHRPKHSVVAFAQDIITMQNEIDDLRYENERLKEYETKYTDLLNSSIRHSNDVSFGMLQLAMAMEKPK